MKAMVLKHFGGPENLVPEEVPQPVPDEGEVLVEVRAIGIDQIDIKSRKGEGMTQWLEKEDPLILGWDIAGVVRKAAKGAGGLEEGDAVFGTVNFPGPGSSYAEYAAAPADQLARKPDNISFEEAAAATQSPLTAWQALVDTGNIRAGQRVLIHGGAGGVGNYAVQIAHNRGCYVISTASEADREFVRSLGADEVIDYKNQKFEELLSDIDFVLDTVGGENFVRSLGVLKPDGMIVLLPSNKKDEADKAAAEHYVRNYKHVLMHSSGEDMRRIAEMLAQGTLKVHVDRVFPFEELPKAHEQLENGKIKGKIVVSINK